MVRTIKIGFYEPFTGIWVEGKNEYWFKDKAELENTCSRWKMALREKYNSTKATVEVCDWDWGE